MSFWPLYLFVFVFFIFFFQWATTVDGKEASPGSHTPSKRPRGLKQQIQSLLISSPTKKSKYATTTTTTTTTTKSKKKSKKGTANGNGKKEPTEGAKYEAERRRKRKTVLALLKPFLNVKVSSFFLFSTPFVCWSIHFFVLLWERLKTS